MNPFRYIGHVRVSENGPCTEQRWMDAECRADDMIERFLASHGRPLVVQSKQRIDNWPDGRYVKVTIQLVCQPKA